MTNPLTQVPPDWIEKVPFPEPPFVPSVGFAVNVKAPAVVPVAVLLTVMVAFLVVVPPLFIAGDGALKARVAPVTVKLTPVAAAPPGPVTLIVCVPSPAFRPIVIVTVSEVPSAFTVGVPNVMPVPEEVTPVTPVRLEPLKVAVKLVAPRSPVFGLIVDIVGRAIPMPLSDTGKPFTVTLAVIAALPV